MILNRITLLLSLVFLLWQVPAQAQKNEYIIDSIQNDSIQVINEAGRQYSMGPASELTRAFGAATITQSEDEVLGGIAYFHNYEGVEVYFNDKNFESISIHSNKYTVSLNGKSFKVGEPINKLRKAFPKSIKAAKFHLDGFQQVFIGIMHKEILTDAFVVFEADSKGLITEIWIGNNNS